MSFEKRQIRLLLIILAIATAGLLAVYLVFFRVEYTPVFQNIRESDAAAIIGKLDEGGIPYRLENQGHDVLVPDEQAAEARVLVAGSGVAMGGTVGFELFNDTDMGLTEFAQKINLQRALQGELARTIMGMTGVEFARVHLALPERSIFRSEQGQPTAAVTVQMKPGQTLSSQRIEGIRQLVASSVPGLQAADVAILDERGDLVSASIDVQSHAAPISEVEALEQFYQARGRDAVEVALPGLRFDVSVSARYALDQGEDDKQARRSVTRQDLQLSVLVRTRDDLPASDRSAVEAALVGALGLQLARWDSLVFTTGALTSVPRTVPIPEVPVVRDAPAVQSSEIAWTWMFNRWTLFAGALILIVVLIVRPRRQLNDIEAASFAELLKNSAARQEHPDAP